MPALTNRLSSRMGVISCRTLLLIASLSPSSAFSPVAVARWSASSKPRPSPGRPSSHDGARPLRGSFVAPLRSIGKPIGPRDNLFRPPMDPSSTSAAARSLRKYRSTTRSDTVSGRNAEGESSVSYWDQTWGPILDNEPGNQSFEMAAMNGDALSKALDSLDILGDDDMAIPSRRDKDAAGLDEELEEVWVQVAHRMADAAGEVLRKHFRQPLRLATTKTDGSPVSEADRESEAVMRDIIAASIRSGETPQASILGEEMGFSQTVGGSRYTWVLDPIDGTKSFMAGKPTFGILVALLRDGLPVMGIIDQPITQERWLGVVGRATTLNGEAAVTDQHTRSLEDSILYCTTLDMFHKSRRDEEAFLRLKAATRFCIGSSDCYGYGLVASGHGGLVCEANLEPYDYFALAPILEGAGGFISDWEGNRLTLESSGGRVLAAGNLALAVKALKVLNQTP